MNSIQCIAGENLRAGQAVYIAAANGRIKALAPAGRFRRLCEWLHLIRRRKPLGIVLASSDAGRNVGVAISDCSIQIGGMS